MAEEHVQIPPVGAEYERHVLAWCQEALTEGEAVLKSDPTYSYIQTAIEYIQGDYTGGLRPSALSSLSENRFGKVHEDLKGALTDIRPFWEYRTENDKFKPQAEQLNKLALALWINRNLDLRFGGVIDFALPAGTGYAHQVFSEQSQDIDLIPEDPRDVLPVRPASNLTIQDCFGVLLRRERTVNYLRQLYPDKQHLIVAERDTSISSQQSQSTRAGRVLSQIGLRSGFMENLLARRPAQQLRVPSLDSYTLYVKDSRRNTSGFKVWVGSERHGYFVEPGDPLYPRGRCISFTKRAVLRDGPSIYWHGQFPLIKFTIIPQPWSWLGKAPLRDLIPLQEALNRYLRVMDDHNERVGRPGVIADKNAMSRADMDKLDPRRAGIKIRHNPIAGRPVALEYEPPLDQSIPAAIVDIRNSMNELSGISDLRQLMKLKQIPQGETVEQMLESMSGAVRLRSRVMEVAIREFAEQLASNFFQFYTLPMTVAVLGPAQGIEAFGKFDYDPGTMIPDFLGLPGEYIGQPDTVRPREERARAFLREFTFNIAPGSLLASSEITRKLLHLQLARAGWMSMKTLFDVLGVSGYERIKQEIAEEQAAGVGMSVNAAGRKASGQEMPQMQGRKISESG